MNVLYDGVLGLELIKKSCLLISLTTQFNLWEKKVSAVQNNYNWLEGINQWIKKDGMNLAPEKSKVLALILNGAHLPGP